MVCVGGGAHPPVLRSSMQHTTCSFHTNQHLKSSCNNQSIISKQNPHICCATDAAEHTSGGTIRGQVVWLSLFLLLFSLMHIMGDKVPK